MAQSNYDILGIPDGSSMQRIRIAFRELANEGKLPGVIKSSW